MRFLNQRVLRILVFGGVICLSLSISLYGASAEFELLKPIESFSVPDTVVRDVDPHQAAQVLEDRKDVLVLDIRTPREWQAGMIPGAIGINRYDREFQNLIDALPRDRPLLLYCRTGSRSRGVLQMLVQKGFNQIFHLESGIHAWVQNNLGIEKH